MPTTESKCMGKYFYSMIIDDCYERDDFQDIFYVMLLGLSSDDVN